MADLSCSFCEISFERRLTGRPARFCSKRCRQAAYNETHLRVQVTVRACWIRRRDARAAGELAAALAALPETPDYLGRRDLAATARERAGAAWPSPYVHGYAIEPQTWEAYLSSRAIARDESGVSSR